jgi:hypothetical protein
MRQALIKEAERTIERHARAKAAPVILRPAIGESEDSFAQKCASVLGAVRRRPIAPVPHGFKVIDGVQAVECGPKYFEILHPDTYARYLLIAGGRGSGKTIAVETEILKLDTVGMARSSVVP